MRKARMRGESDSIRLSYGCVGEPVLPRVRVICKVRGSLEGTADGANSEAECAFAQRGREVQNVIRRYVTSGARVKRSASLRLLQIVVGAVPFFFLQLCAAKRRWNPRQCLFLIRLSM